MAKTTNGKAGRKVPRKARLKNHYKKCLEKKRYESTFKAWEHAKYFYIMYGSVSEVYSCNADKSGTHYHLTTKTSFGDGSHLPEDVLGLYSTMFQPEAKPSFWKKLRLLIIENEKETINPSVER